MDIGVVVRGVVEAIAGSDRGNNIRRVQLLEMVPQSGTVDTQDSIDAVTIRYIMWRRFAQTCPTDAAWNVAALESAGKSKLGAVIINPTHVFAFVTVILCS